MFFDTLRLSKRLQSGGFSNEQAEAIAEALNISAGESVATKTDIAGLRTDIANVRKDLADDIAQFRTEAKSEFGQVRLEVAESKVAMIKWAVGSIFTATAVLAAVIRFFIP